MKTGEKRRVIVAGGGTGGHLFPGIAVVEELRRRFDVDLLWVGTERGIEARVMPERGEKLELLEVTPLKGRSPGELLKSVGRLPGAMARAASIVRQHDAELCLGVGGYASGPILAAAAAMGVPTAILEQNAHLGLTNRMLAPLVGRAYLSFEETAGRFGEKARVVGNPVRREFAEAAKRASADPEGFEARARTILVMGGSQGAKALNEIVPAALGELGLGAKGLKVVHQTGAAMRDAVAARYAELGVEAEVVSFIDDMAKAYAAAAAVIARAGATTLAELQAIGRPAILVPYPYAADDHQAKNAAALERAGAAKMIRQEKLDAAWLVRELGALLDDPAKRRAMGEAARRRGRPDAAASIVDDLCQWLGWRGRSVRPPAPAGGDAPESSSGGDEGTKRRALRGEVFYAPRLRAESARPSPRPLVFDGAAFAWS
ncbi:MAG: undecaprenyldiphospho-muramoylpentapeptide beta-N-acetylglucosaminyltransferase [Sandaracinus sp.]|nr:undecaprenyldiphospho-muramoylpentapeptide beta-N-acetylglucosaminyltransferase [Sandaracinus sp.]